MFETDYGYCEMANDNRGKYPLYYTFHSNAIAAAQLLPQSLFPLPQSPVVRAKKIQVGYIKSFIIFPWFGLIGGALSLDLPS